MRSTFAVLLLAVSLAAQQRTPLRAGWTFARATADGGRPAASAFRAVSVPSAWEEHEGPAFDGVGWYRRTLAELGAADMARRLRIVFHGAATEARVLVNGTEVVSHLGAWTPFSAELHEHARCDGNDLLEVRLDEKVGHDTQGFLPIIQPHFGGLWQEVELERLEHALLDREALLVFGERDKLRFATTLVPGPKPAEAELRVRVRVRDGDRIAAETTVPAPGSGEATVPGARRWSVHDPHLCRVEIALLDSSGAVLDTHQASVGFRELAAAGTRLSWNGAPLQVRGVLHWGYEPPGFAPNRDKEHWRRELMAFKSLGFNLVKACLWAPPSSFYEAADEVGLLVWQEYPTWHPQITKAHATDLRREFEELYLHDRSHPSVAFRSLTCETGHSADLDVLKGLYELAHARIPNTLVVDDSSWIEWNRVNDFWDDHPYGNNSWWPGKLAYFAKFIAEHGTKPLLLGEAITGDTWIDLAKWRARVGTQKPWWEPLCLDAQATFERWLDDRFGAGIEKELVARSLEYVMQNRKYQIERFRQSLPDAGYVVSVDKDFRLARMGVFDPHGDPKWDAVAWSWQRDTMLCLDTEKDRRAFTSGAVPLAVRVSHYGPSRLEGPVRFELRSGGAVLDATEAAVALEPGQVSPPLRWAPEILAETPRRLELLARLGEGESRWPLWVLPRQAASVPDAVRTVEALDAKTLEALRGGATVLLRASNKKGSLRTHQQQFYCGAPFVPKGAFADRVPAQLLYDLQCFDLESPTVLAWEKLKGELDPLLLLWDTHDGAEVRSYALLAEARVGSGRLGITTLAADSPAGRFVERQVLEHLRSGPAPARAFSAATLARLEAAFHSETIDLPSWELCFDPDDHGVSGGWQDGVSGPGPWAKVRAGAHWESQGFEHRDGIGWYRTAVEIPASWQGKTVSLVAEGVDDSYRLYVNGEQVAAHGDPATKVTVWLVRTTSDVTKALRCGATNRIVLRVVDHGGAGGIWKPIWLTNGPVDAESDLLH